MTSAFRPTTVDHLLAIEEIRLLVQRYAYYSDGGSGDLVDLFTDDGVFDSSDNDHVKLVGREELLGLFGDTSTRERRKQSTRNQLHHIVATPLITDLSDDEAHGICTYAGQYYFDGRSYIVLEAGRYNDHYVRTTDGWRFRARVLEHLFPSRSLEINELTKAEAFPRHDLTQDETRREGR